MDLANLQLPKSVPPSKLDKQTTGMASIFVVLRTKNELDLKSRALHLYEPIYWDMEHIEISF